MKKLILIDANALVHRAFHALPALVSSNGLVTNAVYGFTSILLKVLKETKPDYVAACFDLAGPTFRHKAYEDYKSHRAKSPQELYDQIPLVKQVLQAIGIPSYEVQGYEADDVIGALAEKFKTQKDLQVIILTGDLDTLQLVDGKKVVVQTFKKGISDTIVYDKEEVIKRYGLGPDKMIDFKGLKGDPSDNIPGVPGIGDKTAANLLKEFGSLEGLYKILKRNKGKGYKILTPKLVESLINFEDQAFFSRELGSIIKDLEIETDLDSVNWVKNFDRQKVEHIFKDFGFYSLVQRLPGGLEQSSLLTPAYQAQKIVVKEVTSEKELDSLTKDIKDVGEIIFYSENSDVYISLSEEKTYHCKLEQIKNIFSDSSILKTGYDFKNITKELLKKGVHISGLDFDIMVAFWLINPDVKEYDLDKIYFNEFKESLPSEPVFKVLQIRKLSSLLKQKLAELGLENVYRNIELPLIPVLAEMELNGVRVNVDSLANMAKVVDEELNELEKNIYKQAGKEFNINSPQQLSEIIFQHLKLKGRVRKTAGGELSTAAPELEKLRDEHPIIDLILDYREYQKIKTTYIDPFPSLVSLEDGRIHTTYNQTGTATGRLSSNNPNLQNIPIKTRLGQEFRRAFVAQKGYKFVSLDYSQIELRVVAHLSKDEKMINAFNAGEDIHLRTASEIFEKRPDEVSPSMRREAKALNFGVIYGMGILGFARTAGVSRQRADEFIKKYFEEFSGIAKYVDDTKREVQDNGFVKTIFGRRRQLNEIFSGVPEITRQAERMATNFPIQGAAADIMKIAMLETHKFIHENYKEDDVRLLLQVHDELIFEVKDELVEKLMPELKNAMESVYKLDVPLIVDAKQGENWGEI